jgi:outer membrane protein
MKHLLVLCLLFIIPVISAQNVLQDYVKQGLDNNLAMKQKESSFRQSLEALKEARGMFYPSLSVNARYTISEGGRVIDFPVGDLMNPVYATLNQLTASSLFEPIENQQILFLRPQEHDTRLRLFQPVFNTDLYYNAKIKKGLIVSEEISLDQYKRELVAEIKKAYYAVGMTESLLKMLRETKILLLENVRVNSKLYENSKITLDNLLRSQTELSKFEQQLLYAAKDKQVATAYFNFLLNRNLSDSVMVEIPEVFPVPEDLLDNYLQLAIRNREEIKSLEQYGYISDLNIKMNRSSGLPDLFFMADYGFQGESYQFDNEHDYLQASVLLTWDLFSGLQNRSRIKQAVIKRERVENIMDEAKSQIALEVINAFNELKASEAGILAAETQAGSAREGFRLVRRKYEERQANLIEFLDARNTLTRAEDNLITSRFAYLSNFAEFEKVTAISKP